MNHSDRYQTFYVWFWLVRNDLILAFWLVRNDLILAFWLVRNYLILAFWLVRNYLILAFWLVRNYLILASKTKYFKICICCFSNKQKKEHIMVCLNWGLCVLVRWYVFLPTGYLVRWYVFLPTWLGDMPSCLPGKVICLPAYCCLMKLKICLIIIV